MNKIKLSVLSLAVVLFAGTLINASPISTFAEDDFIADLHYERFIKVEAGDNFTVALSKDNDVYTFGRNHLGQLGIGNTDVTLSVNKITSRFNLLSGETIIDIDTGRHFTVAVTSENRIFAWGNNGFGQSGNGTIGGNLLTPTDVTASVNPTSATVRKIIAGDENMMVWLINGTVRMTGSNQLGQRGLGNTNTLTTVTNVNFSTLLTGTALIDVGIYSNTAYALAENGKVLTWGDNRQRQVGNNSTNLFVTSPTDITASFGLTDGEKVVSMSIGVNHGVAVTSEYKVFFWGTNSNYALGNGLALDEIKATPTNVTTALKYTGFNTTRGIGTHVSGDYSTVVLPLGVSASNDATFFKVEVSEYYAGVLEYTSISYMVVGLNKFEAQDYVLGLSYNNVGDYLLELEYLDWNIYYEEGDRLAHASFSRTHSIFLIEYGDFTIFGSNLYGEHGVGYITDGGDQWNSNFSSTIRKFDDYVLPYLPDTLTAPLDNYFNYTLFPNRNSEYEALFGASYDQYREPGAIDYYFGDYFTEKEFNALPESTLLKLRQLFAVVFEDEVLHGWLRTDEIILNDLYDTDPEFRYWYRYDMEAYANYKSYIMGDFTDDGLATLDNDIISLLSPAVQTRLAEFRVILGNVQAFEDLLEAFVFTLSELPENAEYEFTYLSDGNIWLEYFYENVELFIELGYGDDILEIFAAYAELSELEQMLLTEVNYWNYDALTYIYTTYFVEAYNDQLYDFMDDVQDGDWWWTWPLFSNIDAIKELLAGIDDLPSLSFDLFTELYTNNDGDEYYNYDTYEYWLFLSEILPYLEEGKDVFDQIMDIEDMDLDNLDAATIKAISDMYEDYLNLSEDAQDLLDPEYVQWLVSLIIEQVESDIEELPSTVEDFDALFNDAETKTATVNSLLNAWNKYQAMSDELRDDMDPEARAHLEALYARYLELTRPSVDLVMIGLILVHLSAGVYFAFKKKDVLVKPVQ